MEIISEMLININYATDMPYKVKRYKYSIANANFYLNWQKKSIKEFKIKIIN